MIGEKTQKDRYATLVIFIVSLYIYIHIYPTQLTMQCDVITSQSCKWPWTQRLNMNKPVNIKIKGISIYSS